jgi:hypothetical protein
LATMQLRHNMNKQQLEHARQSGPTADRDAPDPGLLPRQVWQPVEEEGAFLRRRNPPLAAYLRQRRQRARTSQR